MPRLSRVQFRSVGHPNARFEDVELDFRDPAARPLDSVIWLRNGGGKSSLLNLLFAVIRTDRRDFLGGRADSRQRSIEDYILPDDTGMVAIEWVLDASADELLNDEVGERVVTGVFYERRREREQQLRRLFFTLRCIEGQPETQLEGLPFAEEETEGGRRRTLHGFKQALQQLQERLGQRVVSFTDTQRQWQDNLDELGLDPDLFRYQLRMNLREGGADELFRFANDNEFVDFLLELTVDPTHSEEVGENIELFREQLRRRQREFLPELEFCEGLHERLVPLAQHAAKEALAEEALERAGRQIDEGIAGLKAKLAQSEGRSASLHSEVRRYTLRASEIVSKKEACERLRDAWEHHAAARSLTLARSTLLEHERAAAENQRQTRGLQALQHHLALRRLEDELENLRTQNEGDRDIDQARQRVEELARRYAAALKEAQARGAKRMDEQRAGEHALAEALRADEDHAEQLREALTQSELRERLVQERQRSLEIAREELTASGVLEEGELPTAALARHQEMMADEEARVEALRNDAIGVEQSLAAARETKEELLSRQRELSDEIQRLERRLEAANEAWGALTADGELQRLLQTESLSAEELAGDALSRMVRLAAVYRQRALTARARLATLERDADALRVGGLLAPEPAVAAVLEALSGCGDARSGWADLEARAGSADERRSLAERHPEVARGVIVDDEDFDEARTLLESFAGELPVVVTTPAAWQVEGDQPSSRLVTPAHQTAYFDKPAGRRALAAMEDRLQELNEAIESEESAAAAVGAHIRRIERCMSLYPLDERNELRERGASIHHELDELRVHEEAAGEKIDALRERREALVSAQRQPQESLAKHQRAIFALEHLLRRDEEGPAGEGGDEHTSGQAQKLHEELARLDEAIREMRRKREALREESRSESERLQRLELELESLALSDLASIEAQRGDLDALRAEWRLARVSLDATWEEDGREQLLQHTAQQIARERARRDRSLPEDMSVEELEVKASSLDDGDDLEAQLEALRERAVLIAARRGESAALVERAQEQAREAERAWEAAGSPSLPQPEADISAARRAAHRLQSEASGYADDLREAHAARQRAEEALRQLENDERTLREHLRRLDDARRAAGLPARDEKDVVSGELPESLVDMDGWSEELIGHLVSARQELASLRARHNELTREIRKWSVDKRFDALSGELVQRFRRMDEQQFVEDAAEFMQQLELRAQQLRAAVDEMGRHRRTLTQLTLQLAIEGIRQLELASSVSRLPESLEAFGGERFVDIRLQVPQDPAFRSETIGQLIDELVVREHIPSGIELVQMAVRRLASGLRVRVLNPNPAAHQRRIPVAETAKFSGGEQLTSAILLFCTLANVRARNRGVARQPTTVLILDNPIGRASRRRFIEMQLAFARAMNVQLVYTTAVQDAEALSVMPNLIRLRNEKVDPRRALRLVEREEEIAGRIDAARLTRVDAGS